MRRLRSEAERLAARHAPRTDKQRLDALIDHYRAVGSKARRIVMRMSAGDLWAMLAMTPPEGQPPPEVPYRGFTIVALGKADPGLPGRV